MQATIPLTAESTSQYFQSYLVSTWQNAFDACENSEEVEIVYRLWKVCSIDWMHATEQSRHAIEHKHYEVARFFESIDRYSSEQSHYIKETF